MKCNIQNYKKYVKVLIKDRTITLQDSKLKYTKKAFSPHSYPIIFKSQLKIQKKKKKETVKGITKKEPKFRIFGQTQIWAKGEKK
jgi:hypothetical protein